MVSLDILFLIREHVKQGVAPLQAAEAIMSMTLVKNPTASAKMTIEKRRYIEQHLYRGYWAYECLTVRNADDAICGLCGVAPKVEFAESCPKDCISLSGIKIKWPESPPFSEDSVDVDGFWAEMENKTLEQVAFATVDMITSFDGARVAPYIPPSQRADKVINTESLKALLQSYLEVGCQFLSAGKSSCHTFTGGASSSGGRLTKTCPHQVEIRMEVLEWRKRARQGEVSVDDCRDKILGLLSRFRDVQQQQDKLIEKERFRLDAFRNSINEDTTSRIKSRLNFFCKLNRQHEALLELVRQDVQDCKNICRQYNDTQSNSYSRTASARVLRPGSSVPLDLHMITAVLVASEHQERPGEKTSLRVRREETATS
ncbi:predicted protein [Nematostella vectensis]|uniref:Uncharacterized protein n=1 Tax=Nematostella vectensis TaxID=45351 RepID=A7RKF9_NEMVE|nr:predicted protein [Nematostella vectensis]|eukprot:XP_001639968.1 predicted protein [Nematostella vectensis]